MQSPRPVDSAGEIFFNDSHSARGDVQETMHRNAGQAFRYAETPELGLILNDMSGVLKTVADELKLLRDEQRNNNSATTARHDINGVRAENVDDGVAGNTSPYMANEEFERRRQRLRNRQSQ